MKVILEVWYDRVTVRALASHSCGASSIPTYSLPFVDEIERFAVIWVWAGRGPTLFGKQHQLGVIGQDLYFQVHFFIQVLLHGVGVVWSLVFGRGVHIHQEGKVTKLSCKVKIKKSSIYCFIKTAWKIKSLRQRLPPVILIFSTVCRCCLCFLCLSLTHDNWASVLQLPVLPTEIMRTVVAANQYAINKTTVGTTRYG